MNTFTLNKLKVSDTIDNLHEIIRELERADERASVAILRPALRELDDLYHAGTSLARKES